ncbi:hypothetical protein ACWCOM_18605, partial [Kocuria sp. KH4]
MSGPVPAPPSRAPTTHHAPRACPGRPSRGVPLSTTSESYLVGLIGDGITASHTPAMHEAEAHHHG